MPTVAPTNAIRAPKKPSSDETSASAEHTPTIESNTPGSGASPLLRIPIATNPDASTDARIKTTNNHHALYRLGRTAIRRAYPV